MTIRGPDPLHEIARAILRHPRLTPAVLVYVDEIATWRRGLGRFAWAATSYVGTHIVGFVLLLHYANTTGQAEGGASFTRLLEQCRRRDLCGPAALRTVLTLARAAGYLTVTRGSDKRVQIYSPARKLITKTQDLYRCPMASLDHVLGDSDFAERVRSDPNFIPTLITSAGRQYVEQGIMVADNFPQLIDLMNLTGGCLVVLALVEDELLERPCPSTRALAQQCGASASQVRVILHRAAGHGLITMAPDGEVADAEALASLYRQFVARELALYAKFALGLEKRLLADEAQSHLSAAGLR